MPSASSLSPSIPHALSLTKCEDCMLALIYLGAHLVAFHSKSSSLHLPPRAHRIFVSPRLVACNAQQEMVTSFVLQKAVSLRGGGTEWPQRSGDACCGTMTSQGT